MLNINPFIVIPAYPKSLSFLRGSRLAIEGRHIVSIWGRLFFCISENNLRNRFPLAFAESAGNICVRVGQFWLDYIGVVMLFGPKSVVPRKGVAMGSMPPG